MKNTQNTVTQLTGWFLYKGFAVLERLFWGILLASLVAGPLSLVLPGAAAMVGLIIFLTVTASPIWPTGGSSTGGHLRHLLWLSPKLGHWLLEHAQPCEGVDAILLGRWIAHTERVAQHPGLAQWAIQTLMPENQTISWSPASKQALDELVAGQSGATRQRIAQKLAERVGERGWLQQWLNRHEWKPRELLSLTTHPDPQIRKIALRKLGRTT